VGYFYGLINAMTLLQHTGDGVSRDGTGNLAESQPSHAIGNKPQIRFRVTDVTIFVIVSLVAYVCCRAELVQMEAPVKANCCRSINTRIYSHPYSHVMPSKQPNSIGCSQIQSRKKSVAYCPYYISRGWN
jgi:hypothetical protein